MAAGVVLGYLKYVLGFDSVGFRKGMTEAERELVALQKSFQKKGAQLQAAGKKLSLGITLPLTAFAAKGIKEAQNMAAAMAQVNSALASMGPVAGRSADQLKKAADAFEMSTLFEADDILRKVTANMLTFGSVAGAEFDRAQQAALNLSARLGQDLQSSAVMVGKALNDPVKGLTALSRVGIQFTEAQKEQIKAMVAAGDAAGAQRVILAELERQFGGAAKAAADADPWRKAQVAFKQMAETVGTALLPLIPPLTDAITSVLQAFTALSPETQKWIIIAAGAAAALGPTMMVLGTMLKLIAPMAGLVKGIAVAWGGLKVALGVARVALLAAKAPLIALLTNPVVLGAAVLIGGIYLAWKNWDKITAIVQRVYQGVKTWMIDKLGPIWETIKRGVDSVIDPFRRLYNAVVGNSYIPDLVDGIARHMARLDEVMVAPARAAAGKTADAFAELEGRVKALLDRLFPEVAAESQFNRELADLEAYARRAGMSVNDLTRAIARLREEYGKGEAGLLGGRPMEDGPLVGNKFPWEEFESHIDEDLVKPVKKASAEVIRAYGEMAAGAIGAMKDMASAFKRGDILGGIQIALNAVLHILDAIGRIKGGGGIGGYSPPPFGGFRAAGGPVVPGRGYVVGEDGPEYVSFARRGYVHPARDGGQARVEVVPSPYFNVVVDGRVVKTASPMIGQAAPLAASAAEHNLHRRARRAFPGR